MIRKIIHIDEEKCTGCGLCAAACQEGAIGMFSGKAKLLRDDYCDGLGNCLPVCPAGAIRFIEREAAAFDEAAVQAKKEAAKGSCPGSRIRAISEKPREPSGSQLQQWPVQLKLAPQTAPYFQKARLLLAADCTAYAYCGFHKDFMAGRVILVACPKLDNTDYSEKLAAIFESNEIAELLLVRMEVPCCGGLAFYVKKALEKAKKEIPCRVITLSIEGEILKEEALL